jgi:hypothetical protein
VEAWDRGLRGRETSEGKRHERSGREPPGNTGSRCSGPLAAYVLGAAAVPCLGTFGCYGGRETARRGGRAVRRALATGGGNPLKATKPMSVTDMKQGRKGFERSKASRG